LSPVAVATTCSAAATSADAAPAPASAGVAEGSAGVVGGGIVGGGPTGVVGVGVDQPPVTAIEAELLQLIQQAARCGGCGSTLMARLPACSLLLPGLIAESLQGPNVKGDMTAQP
jgi:hypothetical protein